MEYLVLGKPISIETMQKPSGCFGSVYEFTGNSSLAEIGLNTKFWFRCNYGFSNELPVSQNQEEILGAQNDFQKVLSIFLSISIRNGKLTGQFEEPFI